MELKELLSSVKKYYSEADTSLITKAWDYACEKHCGQMRSSGLPYLNHLVEVALLATRLQLDSDAISAALLHDIIEDTDCSLDEIYKNFSPEIAGLVDGVTKISKLDFHSRAELQAENFRKMLIAMSRDIRVLLIKLCDRLHNMRTIKFLSEDKQIRISKETLEIYAPLAHRLGIHWMKSELEDLSFRSLRPESWTNIKSSVNQNKKEREYYANTVVSELEKALEENGYKNATVSGRPKHFYSIYKKMERRGIEFSEIFDLLGFRILVDTREECYGILGLIHSLWKPIPGRFKDYIALPKPNGYQSLHTSVIGSGGARVEIQIRTKDMHKVAERGIAAHWIYKERGDKKGKRQSNLSWLQNLVETEKVTADPYAFISQIKDDLLADEVFAFSPGGDLLALPLGATPLDFAYYVHSEVGHHCRSARVNGRQVPLDYQLRNGDTVEIITSEQQKPGKNWLRIVVSSRAKQKIRYWLRTEDRQMAVTIGEELLEKELKQFKKHLNAFQKKGHLKDIANELGFNDEESLLVSIGHGKLSASQVRSKLIPEEKEEVKEEKGLLKSIMRNAINVANKSSITINGMDDIVFHFAQCCNPLLGDEVVGYVTRGRGVSIHRRACAETMNLDPQRLIAVQWAEGAETHRKVRMRITCEDTIGMLAALSKTISDSGAGIVNIRSGDKTKQGLAVLGFEIIASTSKQLIEIEDRLRRIAGVIKIESNRGGKALVG